MKKKGWKVKIRHQKRKTTPFKIWQFNQENKEEAAESEQVNNWRIEKKHRVSGGSGNGKSRDEGHKYNFLIQSLHLTF